jgi:general secretion pathway protein H
MDEGAGRTTRGRGAERGLTLVEVLITLAVVAVIGGALIGGMSAVEGARLKGASVSVASAVRTAYARASATSKVVRLVFDFESRTLSLEETSGPMLVSKKAVAGGAASATEAEKQAEEEAESFAKGPAPVKPRFSPVKPDGLLGSAARTELGRGVRFLEIQTAHDEEPLREGRAYLYFWPGGQTEAASVQLLKGGATDMPAPEDVLTVLVQPLTGKAKIERGVVSLPQPRNDVEASERAESAGL